MSAQAQSFAPSPLRPIRQLRNTRQLHRFLFRTVQLPLHVTRALIKGAKFAWNPAQVALRARIARNIGISEEAREVREMGFALFASDRFSAIGEVTSACQKIFDASDMASQGLHHHKKDFLVALKSNGEFLEFPEIFRFISSRKLIDIATGYFGSVPILSGASLWWTPPNTSEEQSQLFHADREDRAVLKMFFNIHDVTGDMGPFTLLPAAVSERIKVAIDYNRRRSSRITDEEVEALGGMEHCISLEGPKNAGACVDTSRCLHFGSRCNSKSRLVLMVRFTECLAPNMDVPDWYSVLRRREAELDEVQKLALGLRP